MSPNPFIAETPVVASQSLAKARRAQSGERIPEVSSLILAAWQHPLFTLTFACGVSLACVVLTVGFVVAHYQATSFVQVRNREDFLLNNQTSRTEDQAFVKGQKLIVMQQQTLVRAIESPTLNQVLKMSASVANVDALRAMVAVEIPSGSEVMTISGMHPRPDVAQAISVAVTEAYLETITKSLRESRSSRLAELQNAAELADRKLAERWTALHAMADRVGAGNPTSLVISEQVQLQNFREVTQQLRTLQSQRQQLLNQLAEIKRKQSRSSLLTDDQLRGLAMQRPEIQLLTSKLQNLDNKIRDYRQVAAEGNNSRIRSMQETRSRLAEDVETAIAQLLPRLRQEAEVEREAYTQVDSQGIEQQLALLEQEEGYLRRSREEQQGTMVEKSGSNSVALEVLRHEIEREEKLADNLWQTINELRIEDQAKPRVGLIELAKYPEVPVRTRQMKMAGAAGLFGFLVSVFVIGYYEWSLCRIRTPQDVADHLPLEIFGENTVVSGYWWQRWGTHRYKKLVSGVSEVAAQLILTSQVQGRLPCIFITSSTDTEPRDAIATELARVLAAAGHRTLLIDSDFQSNVLPVRFGLPDPTPDTCRIMRICYPSNEDFDFLRGDGSNSVSMTTPNGFQKLLEEVRRSYSAIVIHGPPILTCAESVLLATQVDTTLFAVLPEVSRWNLMHAAFHRLQYAGATVLGCVFHSKSVSTVASRRALIANSPENLPQPTSLEEQLQAELLTIRNDLARIASSDQARVSPPSSTSSGTSNESPLHRSLQSGKG